MLFAIDNACLNSICDFPKASDSPSNYHNNESQSENQPSNSAAIMCPVHETFTRVTQWPMTSKEISHVIIISVGLIPS